MEGVEEISSSLGFYVWVLITEMQKKTRCDIWENCFFYTIKSALTSGHPGCVDDFGVIQ